MTKIIGRMLFGFDFGTEDAPTASVLLIPLGPNGAPQAHNAIAMPDGEFQELMNERTRPFRNMRPQGEPPLIDIHKTSEERAAEGGTPNAVTNAPPPASGLEANEEPLRDAPPPAAAGSSPASASAATPKPRGGKGGPGPAASGG